VESEPGAGSKFWVELRLADAGNKERVALHEHGNAADTRSRGRGN
jgi:hypothetical protein